MYNRSFAHYRELGGGVWDKVILNHNIALFSIPNTITCSFQQMLIRTCFKYTSITSNMQLKTFSPLKGLKLSTFDEDSYNIDSRIFFNWIFHQIVSKPQYSNCYKIYRERNRLQKKNESLILTQKDAVAGRHGAAIGNRKTRFKLSNKRWCKKKKKKKSKM